MNRCIADPPSRMIQEIQIPNKKSQQITVEVVLFRSPRPPTLTGAALEPFIVGASGHPARHPGPCFLPAPFMIPSSSSFLTFIPFLPRMLSGTPQWSLAAFLQIPFALESKPTRCRIRATRPSGLSSDHPRWMPATGTISRSNPEIRARLLLCYSMIVQAAPIRVLESVPCPLLRPLCP